MATKNIKKHSVREHNETHGDGSRVKGKRKKLKPCSADRCAVYGVFPFQAGSKDGMIVFFQKRDAETLEKVWAATRSAKTWREFRERMPRKQYAEVMSYFDYGGDARPRGNQPFDKTDVWLTSEDWSPLESMLDFLPNSVVSLGQRADTPGMGDWVSFEPSQEAKVVEALKAAGWRVVRDDALARRAGGDFIDNNFA